MTACPCHDCAHAASVWWQFQPFCENSGLLRQGKDKSLSLKAGGRPLEFKGREALHSRTGPKWPVMVGTALVLTAGGRDCLTEEGGFAASSSRAAGLLPACPDTVNSGCSLAEPVLLLLLLLVVVVEGEAVITEALLLPFADIAPSPLAVPLEVEALVTRGW